jgi:hypothetical protein
MIHLHPLSEEKASNEIKFIYEDIKKTLDVQIVPLIFQYIANFPAFLEYMWGKSRNNIHSTNFPLLEREVVHFASETIPAIYEASSQIVSFVQQLAPHEKQELKKTTNSLEKLNAKLLIFGLGMRESIKGVFVGQLELSNAIRQEVDDAYFLKQFSVYDADYNKDLMLHKRTSSELDNATNMLVPLFGSQAISIFQVPKFYDYIYRDLEKLQNTERYLATRVGLEKTTLSAVERLQYPLGTSYQELVRLAGTKPYFTELLYLLVDTFPSNFPRMLLTTKMMQLALA